MRNSISRLWWTAKLTYDEKRKDRFELTRLIWEKQDIHVALMERSFGTYPTFTQTFLEFYGKNKSLSEDNIRAILRGLNAIGGVKVLSLLSKFEIEKSINDVASFNKISI